MRLLYHSLLLIISFGLIYLWQNSAFSVYTIPVLGFLIFIYIISSFRQKQMPVAMYGNEAIGVFVLNTVIFLLVFSTTGLSSPLFFLLYFLGFGIAFVLEPAAVFIYAIGAFLVFLPEALKGDVMGNLIKTASVLLIAPIPFFFGKEFKSSDELRENTSDAAKTIAADVAEVVENEKENLKSEDVEKLNEVLEESESLRDSSK